LLSVLGMGTRIVALNGDYGDGYDDDYGGEDGKDGRDGENDYDDVPYSILLSFEMYNRLLASRPQP
jgi:hypothetical protein